MERPVRANPLNDGEPQLDRTVRQYNVLLAVIDALRADHLSSFGYHRKTTPNLDARIENWTRFANCASPVGWTLPSCASIVTGQPAEIHGLDDHNGRFQSPKLGHLLGNGYRRIAFTNNGNLVPDTISVEYLESLGLKRKPSKWKRFGWQEGFDAYLWTHREDHLRTFCQAEQFLDQRALGIERGEAQQPYFIFFHTNIVHDYNLDRPYYLAAEKWLGRPLHRGLREFPDGPEIWNNPPEGVSRERMIEEVEAKYDAGIEFADRMLKGILDRVDFSDTIVVLVSDHGEGFEPEVGRVHHCGRLHQDLLHVPLFIWLPPVLRERYFPPAVEAKHSSTLDIVPTVLNLLGISTDGLAGRFLLELPTHRRITGRDRGYIFWKEDCVRESYDTCRIEIHSTGDYPLKWIRASRNEANRETAYNLAYDPGERVNLLDQRRPSPNWEPISFIVCVDDQRELEQNLLASPVARSAGHQWILIDNRDNRMGHDISRIYGEALRGAEHDLVFCMHQDLYLPPGWEEQVFLALRDLENRDPCWGVIGAVGVCAVGPTEFRGHWCDPHGYFRAGDLPAQVQSLDEQWLGLRRSRGPAFDPDLPGFHCYGIDLSLAALEIGLKSWAVDAFVWHKYRDARGNLINSAGCSTKIVARGGAAFQAQFALSAEYVGRKWAHRLPFRSTSWAWR